MDKETCAREISIEIGLIEELIATHIELIRNAERGEPGRIEISAAAALLHSFYNGIENIFQRIARRIDKTAFDSDFWHQELLDSMTIETPLRTRVISPETAAAMKQYLGFRHFFRHSYAFHLQWNKMRDLVLNIDELFVAFKKEIDEFLSSLQ